MPSRASLLGQEAGLDAFAAGLLVDAPGGDAAGERAQARPAGVALGEPVRLGDAAERALRCRPWPASVTALRAQAAAAVADA